MTWIEAVTGDFAIRIYSRHGTVLDMGVEALYLVHKWGGQGEVLLNVNLPAGADMDGAPTQEIKYQLVIREKMT